MENTSEKFSTKKRSKGVTIIATIGIILNIFTLFSAKGIPKTYSFLPQPYINSLFLFVVIYTIVGVICVFNLLRLKEWSRKLAVTLAIITLGLSFIFVPLNHKAVHILAMRIFENSQAVSSLEHRYDNLSEQVKSQITKEEFMTQAPKYLVIFSHLLQVIYELITYSFNIIVLIFFTRPKVKRQFMERNPERSER